MDVFYTLKYSTFAVLLLRISPTLEASSYHSGYRLLSALQSICLCWFWRLPWSYHLRQRHSMKQNSQERVTTSHNSFLQMSGTMKFLNTEKIKWIEQFVLRAVDPNPFKLIACSLNFTLNWLLLPLTETTRALMQAVHLPIKYQIKGHVLCKNWLNYQHSLNFDPLS